MFRLKKDMANVAVWDTPTDGDPANKAIDVLRPIKVIVIGAGMSGMTAGILFPRSIQNLELVIYEKNADVGGTWFENRYPGLACDIPSHTYQFTFEENTQWSSFYATGPEIHKYLKHVNTKYKAEKYMKFNHKVEKASWNDETGKWAIEVKNMVTGETITDTADVVCSAVGILNAWKWPEICGLHDFKGKLVHSAAYPEDLDVSGKRVALIGAGSSGIQMLPQIRRHAAAVDHYVRGKLWIPPAGIGGEGLEARNGDPRTPAADLERFKNDPEVYRQYRRYVEDLLNRPVEALYKGTPGAKMFADMCRAHMKEKLSKKPEVFEALVPDYPVGCRRITPGPGVGANLVYSMPVRLQGLSFDSQYLEALVEDNVNFIPTKVRTVYDNGIETEDGVRRDVDVIICATGFDGVYKQHFPVHGKYGVNLQDIWDEMPEAYLSMAPRLMPNFYVFLGPNGGPGLGSTVPFLELQCRYMTQVIQKIQREYIKSMMPTDRAMRDWADIVDSYFAKTIYVEKCNAWWKHKSGRLLAIWPGSLIHGAFVFRNPRWEDYEYEHGPESRGNSLRWFGNGLSQRQIDMKGTTEEYLDTPVPVEIPLEILGHGSHTNGFNGTQDVEL
ncbi:hypothetical protein AYO20_00242 [Fonsecaea nubica]|uniref:Uncharacterized protein n=1 Tax=Fonsecaea nubica TaxID=856822 RepID=A0A178DFF6_9EURO|nr:hypothetical protein AYO20_00242 [Fonsecaea nubica]OAL40506.1 hypothetical protein AYO20_00242 [Fonsecaea nubica]